MVSHEKSFLNVFNQLRPDQDCLIVEGQAFPPTNHDGVIRVDLSSIVPITYALAYGQGTLRQRAPKPRLISEESRWVELAIRMGPQRLEAVEPMVLRSTNFEQTARLGQLTVGLLNMAFYELYLFRHNFLNPTPERAADIQLTE